MDFNRILAGMIRAARLEKEFYEEVEHDPSYGRDALVVVILAALAGGLGGMLGALFGGEGIVAIVWELIIGVVRTVIAYYVWVFVSQWVGTRFFKGTGDFGEVQRALGFAYAPQVLNLFSFLSFVPVIRCVAWIIPVVVALWSLASGFIAIRQSLDQDDSNAALTMIVSFLVWVVAWLIISIPLFVMGLA